MTSKKEFAKSMGVSERTVERWLKQLDINDKYLNIYYKKREVFYSDELVEKLKDRFRPTVDPQEVIKQLQLENTQLRIENDYLKIKNKQQQKIISLQQQQLSIKLR